MLMWPILLPCTPCPPPRAAWPLHERAPPPPSYSAHPVSELLCQLQPTVPVLKTVVRDGIQYGASLFAARPVPLAKSTATTALNSWVHRSTSICAAWVQGEGVRPPRAQAVVYVRGLCAHGSAAMRLLTPAACRGGCMTCTARLAAATHPSSPCRWLWQ